MTPEQQRIAIAEACGKQHCPNCPDQGWYMTGPTGYRQPEQCEFCDQPYSVFKAPNYPSDLNACHEMEKVLTYEQICDYGDWLPKDDWGLIHATAAQRAEAFLRTIGKWEEGQS